MKLKPLEYALYLLKLRDRSAGEIRHKMAVKGCDKDKIEEVILFLTDKKFLDDKKFAKNFIKNQLIIRPQGKYRLGQKLKQLYVDPKTIEDALAQIDTEEERNSAKELAERWLARRKDVDKKYEKLGQYLASRGFNYEIIKKILQNIKTDIIS